MHVCKRVIVGLDLTVFLIWTGIFWLVMLAINSRMDLSKYNILIYPLLLVARSERAAKLLGKMGEKRQKLLAYIGDLSILVSTSMLIVFPATLIINELFISNEIFAVGAIRVYNFDTVLVIIFSLAVSLLSTRCFMPFLLYQARQGSSHSE